MSDYYLLCHDCMKYRNLNKPDSDHFHTQAAAFVISHAGHRILALTDSSFVAQDCDERYEEETETG